ncbi:hypothetical protein KIW84_044170 [Lathyrus oleraceus]|uniref:Hexosyltransferase n=1 Tax=Pisum sativum TaxID=3888 RepID=A0A9D5AVJ6_PEA|nr:hypothetical protein KIW84_044170 [Pisum sativum]
MPNSSNKFHGHNVAAFSFSSRRSAIFLVLSAFLLSIATFLFFRPFQGNRCLNSNPRSVKVVWEHSTAAGTHDLPNRHKVMGFVGIQTGFGSVRRRESLRKTWFPSDQQGLQRLEESTGLAFRFVIGRTSDNSKMSALRNEVAEYDDFILLDIQEEYTDDDIYLRPDRLSLLLAKERSHTQTYIGCMKKGPVFTDPKLKWYEPLSHLLGKEYFFHAYGPIYALSADVVSSLVVLRNDRVG